MLNCFASDLEVSEPVRTGTITLYPCKSSSSLAHVRLGSVIISNLLRSVQQLDAARCELLHIVNMSSPASKAKQPSIHAFFGGPAKKTAPAVKEKEKPPQVDKPEKKKRSAPASQAADGKDEVQVRFTPLLVILFPQLGADGKSSSRNQHQS